MKFEQQQSEFRPVIITLESRDEVEALTCLLGRSSGSVAGDLFFNLYQKLEKVAPFWMDNYKVDGNKVMKRP